MVYQNALLDAVLVPAGLLLLASYHAWLVTQIKRRPLATVLGAAHANRRTWVQCVMKESNATNGMLAVQSLRNSIMACVLLASTSATGAVAIATILTSIRLDSLQESLSSMTVGSVSSDLLLLKVFCVFLCFLFAFLCHTQAIRFLSHVNFLITIPIDPETSPGLSISYVQRVLAIGDNFCTVGNRSFYFLLPLALWFFGPIPIPAVTAQKDIASLMLGCLHSESLNSTLLQQFGHQAAEPPVLGISNSFAHFQEPSTVREAWLVEQLQEAQERAESGNQRVKHLERQVALMLREMGDAQRLVAGLSRKNAELQGEMAQLMLAHMVVGLAEAGAGGLELGNGREGGGEAGGMEEGRGDSEEVIQPSSRQT
ncbi:unnamed protein product [Closterium sp. Yama58-4]|nr:unnamed protein product [Closterium sp. Yama58-4]